MLESRRRVLDTFREGPALFAGLPGDEVDLDRLAAHLVDRGIDGGIYATDGSLEGLLWIQQGTPGETWFFEAGGQEAVLPVTTSRDLLLDIAARGGTISVFVGAQPDDAAVFGGPPEPVLFSSGPMTVHEPPTGHGAVHARDVAAFFEGLDQLRETDDGYTAVFPGPVSRSAESMDVPAPELAPWSVDAGQSPSTDRAAGEAGGIAVDAAVPAAEGTPLDAAAPLAEGEHHAAGDAAHEVSIEPPARPWPAILSDVAARVVRHRGPKLGAQFTAALGRALGECGGRIDGDRIVAPPLPESTWRAIVEAGCAPITAVAGRAFVDRTIAAAERTVRDADDSRE